MIKISETAERVLAYCDSRLIKLRIQEAIAAHRSGREDGIELSGPYIKGAEVPDMGMQTIGKEIYGSLRYSHLKKRITGSIKIKNYVFSERKITCLDQILPSLISSEIKSGSKKLEDFIEINLYKGRRVISLKEELGCTTILLNVGEITKNLPEEYQP